MEGTGHENPFSTSSRGTADAGEVKRKASEVTRTARERAMSTLDGRKERLSRLLDRMADTAQGDELGGFAADYARRGSAYLRDHPADEIVSSLRSAIRARPGLLLSACFVAGLAVARVLRRDADGGAGWGRADRRGEAIRWDSETMSEGGAGSGWRGNGR